MRQVCCAKIAGSRLAAAIQTRVALAGCIGWHHGWSHRRTARHRLWYCRRFKSRGKEHEKENDRINLISYHPVT